MRILRLIVAALFLSLGAAVFLRARAPGGAEKRVLTLGAYTAPREAFRRIIPLFQTEWFEKTGSRVEVRESYLGSGAQSRAIAAGFEADVTVLALEADVARLREAGLITRDGTEGPYGGIVAESRVAFAVPRGNPKNLRGWADLARPGLELVTPNPKTSGGAQWNFLAVYEAARRGCADGFSADEAGAAAFARALWKNVTVMDKGARESILTFERGLGDAALTYENEVLLGRRAGENYELVVPSCSVVIEIPAAVVDVYADKHGARAEAEAFVEFLTGPAAQRIFAEEGFRPVEPGAAREFAEKFAPSPGAWRAAELGGWEQAGPAFFGPGGIYERVLADVHARGGAR
ncbi:MAG: sulfate ABC transporter substrate-binding protein [Elusimicrobiota bacterium]